MKFVLLLVVVLGIVWLLRSFRKPTLPPHSGSAAPPAPGRVENMVSCAQCGLHLPRSDAYPGRGGMFCSEAHRSAFESQRSG